MELIYDRDTLKEAVAFLLDRKFGKGRTEQVRARVKGLSKDRCWFVGKRRCLRIFLDIAAQPSGRLRVLDLLDKVDARREAMAKDDRAGFPAVYKEKDIKNACSRRYYQRMTAAVMAEEVRRARVGEPPLTPETKKEFLERRRAYWDRRMKEYIAKYIEEHRKNGQPFKYWTPHSEAADMMLQEELDKLERVRQGILDLSDSAKRRLAAKNKNASWQQVNRLLEARKH